jgi:formylglycine-generating enzyme required for sulfatase activity
MKKIVTLSILIFISLSGCTSDQEKIAWLLEKQKENMVFVKGGSFMMGDVGGIKVKDEYGYYLLATPQNIQKYPDKKVIPIRGERDALPSHKVTLSDYSISKHLVTWEEFDTYYEIIGKERYRYSPTSKIRQPNFSSYIPWQEAKNFCKFLATHSGLNYDLPTEAQWEYAARSRGKYVFFATNNGLGIDARQKILYKSDKNLDLSQNMASDIDPVGTYPPNPLGLHDMSGSGWQWMNDWYDENYYKTSPEFDPKGAKKGERKVIRGGDGLDESIVFNRWSRNVKNGKANFRCVLNP